MNHGCVDAKNMLSAENVANMISFLSLIVGIFLFFIGRKKFIDYMEYKKESQIKATFGFNKHLGSFVSRLRHLTTSKDTEGACIPYYATWYLLSEKLKEKGNINHGNDLKNLSNEILHYFSTAPNQVSPVDVKENEWSEKIELLHKFLTIFSSIGSRPYYECDTEEAIRLLCKELDDTLGWIEEKINPKSA